MSPFNNLLYCTCFNIESSCTTESSWVYIAADTGVCQLCHNHQHHLLRWHW